MDAATTSYACMLTGLAIMAVVPSVVLMDAFVEGRKRTVRRLTGEPPSREYGAEAMVHNTVQKLAIIACLILIPLGALGFRHVVQLTPQEFMAELQNSIHLGPSIR